MLLRAMILASWTFFSLSSWAYLGIDGSAELPKVGKYVLGGYSQLMLNEGGGAQFGANLDMGFSEELATQFSIGVGKIDFNLGAGFKWIPIPDFEKQPAMGFKVSAWYARTQDANVWTIQIAPMFSKKVQTDSGLFIPYAAIPVNVVYQTDNSHTGTQFTIGAEYHSKKVEGMYFSGEAAVNLKDAYSFVGASINFPFDSEKGFSRSK